MQGQRRRQTLQTLEVKGIESSDIKLQIIDLLSDLRRIHYINPRVYLEAYIGRSNTTIIEERRKYNRGRLAANRLNSGRST
jgi:hypothetical protein